MGTRTREEKINEFSEAILKFLTRLRNQESGERRTVLGQLEKEYEDAQRDYFKRFANAAKIGRDLAATRKALDAKREEFEDDFEQILQMADVRKVSVHGETLIIHTRPVTHVASGVPVEIGQYEIIIDYSGNPPYSKKIIDFKKGPYLGTHDHPNANERGETCFGINDEIGLNNQLSKLVVDFDLIPAIHLIFAFLKQDIDPLKPRARNEFRGAADHSGYPSPQERELEKANYTVFCRRVLRKMVALKLEQDFSKAQEDKSAAEKKALEIRSKMKPFANLYNIFARTPDDNLREKAQEEAVLFSYYENVQRIFVERDNLFIVFLWKKTELVLELSVGSAPRLRLSNGGSLRDLSGILTNNGYLKTEVKFFEIIAGLNFNSRIFKSFTTILGALNSSVVREERHEPVF